MVWLATLLAHLLALFLSSANPIRAILVRFGVLRPMRWHPQWRSTYYLYSMLSLWLQVLLLVVICFGLGWSPHLLGLQLPTNRYLAGLFLALGVMVILAVVLMLRLSVRDPSIRSSISTRISTSTLAFIVPRTSKERFLFAFLSLTAGFCEELLYRGFLLLYLTHMFPHVSMVPAILIAALAFGLAHVSNGRVPALLIGVAGLAYGFLYFITGSIFLPMIVHALLDLRILLTDWTRLLDQPEPPVEETSLPSV
jgi:uncharacterized protein